MPSGMYLEIFYHKCKVLKKDLILYLNFQSLDSFVGRTNCLLYFEKEFDKVNARSIRILTVEMFHTDLKCLFSSSI